MQEKTTADIFYENLNRYMQEHPHISMNNLSREIGANKSYLQKMMESRGTPSFEKIDLICESIHVEVWDLFRNHAIDTASQKQGEAIELIRSLPESVMPTVLGILKVLKQTASPETK